MSAIHCSVSASSAEASSEEPDARTRTDLAAGAARRGARRRRVGACAREATFRGDTAACMAPGVVTSGCMKPRDHRSTSSSSRWRSIFACSRGTRSLTTRETFLSLQATLFVQCVRVLSHGVRPHSVGCPLCGFGGDARWVRRNDASAGGVVRRRRRNKKKQKNLWRTLRRASRRRRRRTFASSFNLMSRYLSSLSKLSAPTGFGFPSYAWCTRYCTPPIAVMAPTMMAKGGKDSNGCGWFRATTARRSGRRGGKARGQRGEGRRFGFER